MPESPTDRPVPDNLLKEGTRREIMVGRGREKGRKKKRMTVGIIINNRRERKRNNGSESKGNKGI